MTDDLRIVDGMAPVDAVSASLGCTLGTLRVAAYRGAIPSAIQRRLIFNGRGTPLTVR